MRVPVAVLLLCATSLAASAQRSLGLRAGVVANPQFDSAPAIDRPDTLPATGFETPEHVLQFAPLASAAIPGVGQAMLGNHRAIAYLALETFTWVQYFQDRRDQATQERAFKDIATRVARAHFTANPPDGPWAYYEQMRDFLESGVYSKSTTSVVPETDTTTYNGHKWLVLKLSHTDSLEALALYQQQAYKPEFEWSWRNAGLQWDLFKRATGLRNDASRRRGRDLEIVLANHFLSMIDAFTTFRLRAQPTTDGGAALGVNVTW